MNCLIANLNKIKRAKIKKFAKLLKTFEQDFEMDKILRI